MRFLHVLLMALPLTFGAVAGARGAAPEITLVGEPEPVFEWRKDRREVR